MLEQTFFRHFAAFPSLELRTGMRNVQNVRSGADARKCFIPFGCGFVQRGGLWGPTRGFGGGALSGSLSVASNHDCFDWWPKKLVFVGKVARGNSPQKSETARRQVTSKRIICMLEGVGIEGTGDLFSPNAVSHGENP